MKYEISVSDRKTYLYIGVNESVTAELLKSFIAELGCKSGSKHALVVSRENIDDYSFVETLLINAGYQSKMFTDESSAIETLEN
jgi:hypothetical protein